MMVRVIQFRQPVIVEDTSKGRFLTDIVLYHEAFKIRFSLEYKIEVNEERLLHKKHIDFFAQIALN